MRRGSRGCRTCDNTKRRKASDQGRICKKCSKRHEIFLRTGVYPLLPLDEGKFRPQHQSEQAWAFTLNQHTKPKIVYEDLVQSWQERLNAPTEDESQFAQEDASSSSSSSSFDNLGDMCYNTDSLLHTLDPFEETERVLYTTLSRTLREPSVDINRESEVQQAKQELMDALMRWGLLQQHDLPILLSD